MAIASDNHGTADRGRMIAATELARRGARVEEVRDGRRRLLSATVPGASSSVLLRVKARTGGTWQGDTRDGVPNPVPPSTPTFWLFVDLSTVRPAFYVVPDDWMRRDIYADHQRYLQRHGGQRAHTLDSTHHAIQLKRIAEWRDRWDLVGL